MSPLHTDDPLEALLAALEAQESGGDSSARNERTNAHGRYQILPSNWGPWSREVFGEEVEPTPANQEAVARHKLGQYVEQFGPEGALVAWYGGPGRAREWVQNPENPWFDRRHGGGKEPSVREYVDSVMGRVGEMQQAAPGQQALPSEADVLGFLGGGEPTQTPEQALPSEADVLGFLGGGQEPSASEIAPQDASESVAVDPRSLGREHAQGMGPIAGRVAAAGQGVGSGLFGIGTPLTAVEAVIGSRLRGDMEPLSWDEALEYARGRREGLREEQPGAYWTGFGGSMVGGIRAGTAALGRAPQVVQSVIRPARAAEGASRGARTATGAANVARYSGTGAATAGVTAGLEEGAEAAPGAAVFGGAAAPLAVGGLRGGGALWNRFRPGEGRHLGIIGARFRGGAEELQSSLERWKWAFPGRSPRAADILDTRSAEEMATLAGGGGRVGAQAGRVFRDAAEAGDVARARDVPEAIRRGGPATSVPAEEARLLPIRDEAGELLRDRPLPSQPTERVGGRLQTSESAVSGRATARYREVMEEIGEHELPVTPEMLEKLQHPDIQGGVPQILRRRLNQKLGAGEEAGAVTVPMHMWDTLRKELGKRSGQPGASALYGDLRDEVTAYVTERVPAYGRLLDEYGRRSQVAAGVSAGRAALTKDTKEFSDMLRTAGGGAPDRPIRPRDAAMTHVGARIGARTNLAHAFSDPERASRMMERLARDEGLRSNLRSILQPEELRRLEDLARRYGHQLDLVEGARVGASGITTAGAQGRFSAEAAAVRARPGGGTSLEQSARGRLADLVEDNPLVAEAMTDPGMQNRLMTAFGGREAARLSEVGAAAAQSHRNLATMAPASTEAQQRLMQQASDVQTAIGVLVIAGTGRASAAMQASTFTKIMQRFRMSPRTAERTAELLVDPHKAHQVIAYLKSRGATNAEIQQMYLQAAAAAGILAGTEGGGGDGR